MAGRKPRSIERRTLDANPRPLWPSIPPQRFNADRRNAAEAKSIGCRRRHVRAIEAGWRHLTLVFETHHGHQMPTVLSHLRGANAL